MNKGYYITGTGTDIGKTYVSALLINHLSNKGDVGYYKGACSGAEWVDGTRHTDATFVASHTALNPAHCCITYTMNHPYSPHLAACLEGITIDLNTMTTAFKQMQKAHSYIVVEGSGGIVCPLYEGPKLIMQTDLMHACNLPLIIVCNSALGSINQAVMSASYAVSHNLTVAGFIMNHFDVSNPLCVDNKRMIETLTNIKVLGYIQTNSDCIVWSGPSLQ